MKNSKDANGSQEDMTVFDPETGEIGNADALFGAEGTQQDGTIILPKITMATIRAMPERAKIADRPMKMALVTGIAGGEYLMPKMDDENRLQQLGPDATEYQIFSALVAAVEPWGCVRFDNDGEPDAVYKSDYLFLPTYHVAIVQRMRQVGQVAIALELWAQPASNVRGYSWFVRNLAKYDGGMSPVDRMLKLGVEAGRRIPLGASAGLLQDLRANPKS